MRIERLNKCCGSRGNLSAVDFQPHSRHNNIHRIATSGGTYVQIWAISKSDDKLYTLPVKCVLLFSFKDHSPYDVTTLRWSPNGQYLASTDSGGITNILRRNEAKTELMERIVMSKLSGDTTEIPESFTDTTQVTKYMIKYDGTDKSKRNNSGISRISLTSKNVQVESKEVKSDGLNLLDYNNLDGNLESWETVATLSCPNNMGQLFDISWAPDSRSIIGGGMNGHVIVFDIHTKEIVAKFDALENKTDAPAGRGYIKSVSWDPMTLFVAVQSSNKEISLWRRSPPLAPGSPVKWTFKRVLYQDQFAQASNADVLGGSRISWAPNGKSVVFPNSSINVHNFSTCYQINHNTANFSRILRRNGYDKNQVQYHFDMSEHSIEPEPLLLRGHTSRIRNVRFSPDIMKSNLVDAQNDEKYFLLAQSSDDNMLSVWRFRTVLNAVVNVECVCVIKNFLDEQSSIEDLSWGDFGRCLAVASSQGGLILIHFSYEDIGAKFYTNRIQGMSLNDMSQPSADLFSYSEQVNDIRDDSRSSSERMDMDVNQSSEGANRHTSSASLYTQSKVKLCNITSGVDETVNTVDRKDMSRINRMYDRNIIINGTNAAYKNISTVISNSDNKTRVIERTQQNINESITDINSICRIAMKDSMHKSIVTRFYKNCENFVLTVYLIRHLAVVFLIVCYRIYSYLIMHKIKLSKDLLARGKIRRGISEVYSYGAPDFFYLFNFTIESEGKVNQTKRRVRGTKRVRTSHPEQEAVHEIWLDMDYGVQNTLMSQYWKDSEYASEGAQKENEVPENKAASQVNDERGDVKSKETETSVIRTDKTTKGGRGVRSDRSTRATRSGVNSVSVYSSGSCFNGSMFSHPVLRSSIAITVSSRKVLGVNFSKSVSSLTSCLCCFEDVDFKVHWLHNMKRGYITHIECLGEFLVVLSQKFDGEAGTYLSALNVNESSMLIDQLELEVTAVSTFCVFKYTGTYFCLITTNLRLVMLKYDESGGVKYMFDIDLGINMRDSIIKIEVVNTLKNCNIALSGKFRGQPEGHDVTGCSLIAQSGRNEQIEFSALQQDVVEVQPSSSGANVKQSRRHMDQPEMRDRLAFIVYKKNRLISIFSQGYEEFELNADSFEFTNNTLSTQSFNLNSLFRFYMSSWNIELFGKMDFSGSLSSVMESFGIEYEGMSKRVNSANKSEKPSGNPISNCGNNYGLGANYEFNHNHAFSVNGNPSPDYNNTNVSSVATFSNNLSITPTRNSGKVNPNSSSTDSLNLEELVECPDITLEKCDLLGERLKVCLLIGSGWEYMLYLHEYANYLFTTGNLDEVLELTQGLYKCMLKSMDESLSTMCGSNLEQISVYDISKYQQLFPHCTSFLRCVLIPTLIVLYREFNPRSESDSGPLDLFESLASRFKCPQGAVPEFLSKISPSFDYSEPVRRNFSQKILNLMKNVQVWENILKF